jgi:sulfur-oxidizing protein SoxA
LKLDEREMPMMFRQAAGRRGGLIAAGLVAGVGAVLGFAYAAAGAPHTPAPLYLEGSAAASPWARYPDWLKTTWDDYSDLAKLQRTPKATGKPIPIPGPITGDPAKGKELAFSRSRGGGCVACHVMGPQTPEVPGNVGPDLSRIGAAGRTDDYLFNYVYDPRYLNLESVMPPWGAHKLYSENEIRDMVAFLKTLQTPAIFRNPLDDSERRPKPVEDRDALDPFVNPAVERIAVGKALTERAGPNGKSCVACHSALQTQAAGWAVRMPQWETRLKKMMGVEEFVYRHAKATIGADYPMQSAENTDLSIYLYSLSNGRPFQVDTSSREAKAVLERGKVLYDSKIGQLNFSCVDCHSATKGANKWIRGQLLGEVRGQMDHYPIWRTSRNEIWDVRKRLQWCNVQVRANDLPPDAPEYDALELYLKVESNGSALTAPNIRH